MTLDEYFRTTDDTAEKLAERAQSTGASISRIRHGKMRPSLDLARRIVVHTGGLVTFEDLAAGSAERNAA